VLVERVANTLRAAGFKVATEVQKGDIREMIIDSAKQWRADLIVVGSHRRKGLVRRLLGSVAESVARFAPCTVEIVRTPATRPKVLLAVDGSKFSEAATQAVIRQVRPNHAEVRILHVVDLQVPIPTSYAGGFRQASLEQGRNLVGCVERSLGTAGFKTQSVIEEGDPRSMVVDYAKKVARRFDYRRLAWTQRTRSILAWERRRICRSAGSLLSRDRPHRVSVFMEAKDESRLRVPS